MEENNQSQNQIQVPIRQSDAHYLKCQKCGSTNINVQVVNTSNYKQGHGCLGFVLFGMWYILWECTKWICKYSALCVYWCCVGWIKVIVAKSKNEKYHNPEWVENMMQKRGKVYNTTHKHCVCQNCGYSWEV